MHPIEKRVLYKKEFVWEDAISELDRNQKELFNALPYKIKTELMGKSEDCIQKGLESGLMYDSNYVIRIAVDGADMFEYLIGLPVQVSEPEEGDLWRHAFNGTVNKVNADYFVIEDQEGNEFNVSFDKTKFESGEGDTDTLQAGENIEAVKPKRKFIVAVRSEYMRDAQIATNSGDDKCDVDSNNWSDFSGEGILLITEAAATGEAKKISADSWQISEEILTAYEIIPDKENATARAGVPCISVQVEKDKDTEYIVLSNMSNDERNALIEAYYYSYYNTDQNVEVFSAEFFFLVGEITYSSRIPRKLKYLSDYKDILKERVPRFESAFNQLLG